MTLSETAARPENGGSNGWPTVSLIIPCWNDCEALSQMLPRVVKFAGLHETIIADASPAAGCEKTALEHGARHVGCPQPNRGAQMNFGAKSAAGDLLLFHHLDTQLDQAHIDSVRRAGADLNFKAAAFHRKFDPTHRKRQFLERWVRLYNANFGALYGDQSLVVRRDLFQRMGGFKEIPLMEDVEITRRLRRDGCIKLLDPPVLSSARRHKQYGKFYTTFMNVTMITLYSVGVSPQRLHKWYYRKGPAGDGKC